jgi:hypothetical protein
MCRTGYAILAGLAFSGLPAKAQSVAELQHRLDSLRLAEQRSHAKLDEYRRAHRLPTDTTQDSVSVVRGRVTIVFTHNDSVLIRSMAAAVDQQLADLGPFVDRITPLRFSVDSTPSRTPARGTRELKVIRYYMPSGGVSQTVAARDPREMAGVIVSRASEAVVNASSSPVRAWHPGPLPLDPEEQAHQNWALARMDVTMSLSRGGRRCYQGDLEDCRRFVGLTPIANPVMDMYDADGRRELVEARSEMADRMNHALADRCRFKGSDSACIALLQMNDSLAIFALANEYSRRSLLTYALFKGGHGASERLMASTGSIGDALAAASNQPLNDLVTGWQQNLREGSVGFGGLSWPIVISSLVWMGLMALVSFRGGRWR